MVSVRTIHMDIGRSCLWVYVYEVYVNAFSFLIFFFKQNDMYVRFVVYMLLLILILQIIGQVYAKETYYETPEERAKRLARTQGL